MRRDFTQRLYARIEAASDISPATRASVGVCIPVIGDAVVPYLAQRPSAVPISPADVGDWAPFYPQLFIEVMLSDSDRACIEGLTAHLPLADRLRGWGVVLLSEDVTTGSPDKRSRANVRRLVALQDHLHALSPTLYATFERRDAVGVEVALAAMPSTRLAEARRAIAETARLLGLTMPTAVHEQREAIRSGASPRWEFHATLWLDRMEGSPAPVWEWAFGARNDGRFHGPLLSPTAIADDVHDDEAMILLAIAGLPLSLTHERRATTKKAGRYGTEGNHYYVVGSVAQDVPDSVGT